MGEDISKKTLLVLVAVALVISIIGAINVINVHKQTMPNSPASQGEVGLTILDENYVSPTPVIEDNEGGKTEFVVRKA